MLTSLTTRLKKYSAELLIVAAFAVLWFSGSSESESRFTKYKISSSSGAFTRINTAYGDVTNLTVTIKSTGRPMVIGLVHDGSAVGNYCNMSSISGGATLDRTESYFNLLEDGTSVAEYLLNTTALASTGTSTFIPCSSYQVMRIPAAGSRTYKVQCRAGYASHTCGVAYAKLYAYELP